MKLFVAVGVSIFEGIDTLLLPEIMSNVVLTCKSKLGSNLGNGEVGLYELTARAIEVKTEWAPNLPAIDLDPVFFSQALHNVLRNSIEAMPSGGRIKVATTGKDGECEVCVTDTGPGVTEQDAPQIFMPFFSTKEQGMGLGLTMADRIMKQLDGELKLMRNEEGGGMFCFRLPAGKESHANHSHL